MLSKGRRFLFGLSLIWMVVILALAAWWMHLILKLGHQIQSLVVSDTSMQKLFFMVKWEGITFFVLLGALSLTLTFLFIQDMRRSHALQAFFASLTHELKTPLASIQLQAEVMQDYLNEAEQPQLGKLHRRLLEDTHKLEMQLDKILHLSRVERGGNLNPAPLNLEQFLKKQLSKLPQNVQINWKLLTPKKSVLADEFALSLVIRNLLENSLRHSQKEAVELTLTLKENGSQKIDLIYEDNNGPFDGELKRLGSLFYKHRSTSGSGIGLYLSKRLMKSMGGKISFHNTDHLVQTLSFPTSLDSEAGAQT